LLEYISIVLVIVVPLSVQAGMFGEKERVPTVYSPQEEDLFLSTTQNPVFKNSAQGGADMVMSEGALVSYAPVAPDIIAKNKTTTGEISVYTVREGDTLSYIADMYGVSVNTILWANDLSKATSIREGQTLIILPISGVRHLVKKGDTISSLAKLYKGDEEEIIAFNQLGENGSLEVGSEIMIPGGLLHTAPVVKVASPVKTNGSTQTSGMTHPAPGAVRSQGIHGYNGVDLATKVGTPIRAALGGEVIVSKNSGWNGGYGQYIVIKHANGVQTLYAHLSENYVGVGAVVSQGQVIAVSGNTGLSTGPHLHFEVRGATNPF